MRHRTAAALGIALLFGPSADPNWLPIPICPPQGLAWCLAAAAAKSSKVRPQPLAEDPADTEVVHHIELANTLTGDTDALRERRVYARTPVLDEALVWLRQNARYSSDFLDLGWLYVWIGDSANASHMFLESARLRPAAYYSKKSPVDGLLKLGLLDDALFAARTMQDGDAQSYFVARQRPAALSAVALALFSAGRKTEAGTVLAEAYQFADRLPPGRTLFGYGAEVDAAKFEAYASLVPVQIALGDWVGAVSRAKATEAFRLAKFDDLLRRAEILKRTGAVTEALRQLAHMLVWYGGPPSRAGEVEISYGPDIAAAVASAGTLMGGVAIMAAADDELRARFGVLVLSQRKDCAHSEADAISLAGQLRLPSDRSLLVEAVAICARAGDDAEALRLLQSILEKNDGTANVSSYEEIAGWAFALRRRDLVERCVFGVLRSDGNAKSVRAATLWRAAALSSKYLDNPSQVVGQGPAVSVKQLKGL